MPLPASRQRSGAFHPRDREGPKASRRRAFNVEAAVRIEGYDDEGRERLVRYCARPCFALERLSILRDGRVAYQVKYPRRKGTHRVMTPIVFFARLAALVRPPRHPLVRYHGVLAPHAKQRSLVDGLLLATSPRVEWAKLLRRTYAVDVLACPRCSGRMRLMAAITDKATARKILSHLGLVAEPLECRARYPADPA
ncbi:transposase [Sorangium sp. So ce426]|uniref:transposase n=1 Tax=Sorangium sp. So ce426 TaxID=3133312 RepID=UPI003F5B352B